MLSAPLVGGDLGQRLKQLVALDRLEAGDQFGRHAADHRLLVVGCEVNEALDEVGAAPLVPEL